MSRSRPRVAARPDGAGRNVPIAPMTPRRRLFAVFAFILTLWIAMMIVLYLTTVYPQRHPGKPAASALSQ
jgi:hypothetical protein